MKWRYANSEPTMEQTTALIDSQGKARWPACVVYVTTLLALALTVFSPTIARQFFYLACALAGLAWLYDWRRPDNVVLAVIGALLLFALYRIGHTVVEAGTLRPGIDAWQVYLSTANRMLMGMLLIGYLSTRTELPRAWLALALAAALLLSLLSAGWQEFVLLHGRGERAQRATLFSYEVVALYFAYLGWQLMHGMNSRMHGLLLVGVSMAALWVVLWTETRAAMLCLLLGGTILVLLSGYVRKWRMLGLALALGTLVLASGYQDFIKPRLTDAGSDITAYFSGGNRDTSIGTRLELWRGSVLVFSQAPWWGGGYLQREKVIRDAVAQQHLDPIAAHYSRVSMHNELLEELSLRGFVGGALLLMLYSAVLWAAVRRRSLALLGLEIAYVFFGLSDVLFFSREATIVFVLLLAVLLIPEPATVQSKNSSEAC